MLLYSIGHFFIKNLIRLNIIVYQDKLNHIITITIQKRSTLFKMYKSKSVNDDIY